MEQDRRNEGRVNFSWPLWFGYEENGQLFKGQVIDLSRSAVSFRWHEHPPQVGDHVVTRFSYPRQSGDTFDMDSYWHWSEVTRVDDRTAGGRRVVLRLHRQLEDDPSRAEAMPLAAVPA